MALLDNMPFLPEHKKNEVVGITYNVVNVAGEAGDASPSTPIGVNLPNSNWIRVVHGSKSVSLGNIVEAYDRAGGSGILTEFAHDDQEMEMSKTHAALAGKLHTAMHEVIGHASGKLEEGIGEPKQTIKEYSSTLEEGRADLVALYFMLDEKGDLTDSHSNSRTRRQKRRQRRRERPAMRRANRAAKLSARAS